MNMKWLDRWRHDRTDEAEDLAAPESKHDPGLENLLARSRSLPREVAPDRDLWSGIENRISGRLPDGESSPWSLTTLFPRPFAAAVVALMLVATTALSVLWWTDRAGTPPSDAQVAAIAQELRERDGVADVHANILAILDAHRTQLPPETIAVLDENLRSIDRAIAEIHLALESNPDHHALGFLLAEAYRSETELLERLEWWLQMPVEATS